jgi:hypothetical protein
MISDTTANLCAPAASSASIFAALRRCLREAALRYLRWRSAAQLRRLDPRTLKDFGVPAREILGSVIGPVLADPRCDKARAGRNGRPNMR